MNVNASLFQVLIMELARAFLEFELMPGLIRATNIVSNEPEAPTQGPEPLIAPWPQDRPLPEVLPFPKARHGA